MKIQPTKPIPAAVAISLVAACAFAVTNLTAKPPQTGSQAQAGALQDDVQGLKSFIQKLPDSSFTQPAHARRRALGNAFDVVGRQIRTGAFGGAIAKLQNHVRPKMDGCLGGQMKNDWITDCPAQREIDIQLTGLVGKLFVQHKPVFVACEQEQALGGMLQKLLGGNLQHFELRKINPERFRSRAASGRPIDVPIVDEQGQLRTVFVSATPGSLRPRNLKLGRLKGNEVTAEPLGPESSWRLGCTDASPGCGGVTFLDDRYTQVEGLLTAFESGVTYIESADNLVSRLLGQRVSFEPGCSAVYNAHHHGRLPFELDGMGAQFNENLSEKEVASHGSGKAAINYTIPIVLDADAQFYALDPDTAWRRQRSILWGVRLIYGVIEPLSSGAFNITFEIKGQEAWRPGYGPTTTNKNELIDTINAPDYFMYTHPGRNELSYFYVGYDMDGGAAGKAGGICGLEGTDTRTGLTWDRTFASDFEHQWTHAWGQQVPDEDFGFPFATLHGRVIAAAHEIGHMLGVLHGLGDADTCAADSGGWSNLCGTSIGLGGGGGADPDDRKPFFTDANDDKIVNCVGRVAIF